MTKAQPTGRAGSPGRRGSGVATVTHRALPAAHGTTRKPEPKCCFLTDPERMQGLWTRAGSWTHIMIKARECIMYLNGRNVSFLRASRGLTAQQLGDHNDVQCQEGRGGSRDTGISWQPSAQQCPLCTASSEHSPPEVGRWRHLVAACLTGSSTSLMGKGLGEPDCPSSSLFLSHSLPCCVEIPHGI